MSDHEQVRVSSRPAWRDWLTAHHAQPESIWLVYPRKSSGLGTLSMDDIVEEALCFGWIDSLPRKLDDHWSMLRISPRKPRSAWSGVNKIRAERMIAAGLMTEAGQRMIDLAKSSGTWVALAEVDKLVVPDDLAAALAGEGDAARHFAAFPPSTRRGILEWIGGAKRPETRMARVAETARLAARNERANQWRGGR